MHVHLHREGLSTKSESIDELRQNLYKFNIISLQQFWLHARTSDILSPCQKTKCGGTFVNVCMYIHLHREELSTMRDSIDELRHNL